MKKLILLLLALITLAVLTRLSGSAEAGAIGMALGGMPIVAGYTAGEVAFGLADEETVNEWEAIVQTEEPQDFFFRSNFVGTEKNNIVQITDKLKGGYLTITLKSDLENDGTTIETALEGEEELLSFDSFKYSATKYENAVILENEISMYRTAFDVRNEIKDSLVTWRDDLIETLICNALWTSPTNTVDITADTSPKMSFNALLTLMLAAQMNSPKIPPIMLEGKSTYVVLISPYQEKDLLKDSTFREALIGATAPGYSANPLWVKANYRLNGMMIYVYDRVPLASNSVAKALLLGRQAASMGYVEKWDWKEIFKDKAERIPGGNTRAILGVAKSVFNSYDHATFELHTTYTPLP